MKVCEYNKCGIHSRLRNVIKKSGGYNRHIVSKILMKTYNVSFDIAYEISKHENVFNVINSIGIDNVIYDAECDIRVRKKEFDGIMSIIGKLKRGQMPQLDNLL